MSAKVTKISTPYRPVIINTELTPRTEETCHCLVLNEAEEVIVPDEYPLYAEQEKKFLEALYLSVRYPSDARTGRKQGTVLICMDIDGKGRVISTYVAGGIYPSLDAEAFHSASAAAEKIGFKPAILAGSAVPVTLIIPVKFKME